MLEDLNHYEPPASRELLAQGKALSTDHEPTARDVFLAWERIRIIYNAILFVQTVALAALLGILAEPSFLITAVAGALVANVAFCAGPCAEGYCELLGLPRPPCRLLLAILGTLFAMFLAAGAVIPASLMLD